MIENPGPLPVVDLPRTALLDNALHKTGEPERSWFLPRDQHFYGLRESFYV